VRGVRRNPSRLILGEHLRRRIDQGGGKRRTVNLDGKALLALAARCRPNVAPRILWLLIGNVFGRSFVIVVDLLLPLLF
jgi:hypothetical protein